LETEDEMKTIVLIDVLWYGHHQTYLKNIIPVLLNKYNVWVICSNESELRSWANENLNSTQLSRLSMFQISTRYANVLPSQISGYFNSVYHWRNTIESIQQASQKIGKPPDMLFFMKIDFWMNNPFGVTGWLANKMPVPWSGIYFEAAHLRKEQKYKTLRKVVFEPESIFHLKSCRIITTLDENIIDGIKERTKKSVIAFPDITDETHPDLNYSLCQNIKQKAGDRKIIGLLGSLLLRKGIDTLVEVIEKMDSEKFFFVIAGEKPKGGEGRVVGDLLDKIVQKQNVFISAKRLNDGIEFNSLLNVCDMIYAAYQNFYYSSNLLTKSALFKKPVIVSARGLSAERVEKYKTGKIVRIANVGDVIEAIISLSENPLSGCDYDGYAYNHRTDRLEGVFDEVVAQCLS
jgi:glycosyltransferase involved in cell wall biosynthesis